MKFRHLAIKNVKESWYQYAAYFYCCMFSVTIFYIFQSLIFHPDIETGFQTSVSMPHFLTACQFLIVAFSFVFVFYSNATFLQSRKKEFRLFMMLGMTRGQLKRLVFYENTVIAVLSIVAGIFVGILFSKLFFMAISVILNFQHPIAFMVIPETIYVTATRYLILFEVITFFTTVRLGRRSLIRLLKVTRLPKLSMFFSIVFTFVSIALIGLGYYWASTSTVETAAVRMFPILGVVILGTFFLFRYASVVILHLLERIKSFFYRRTNMLAVSLLHDKIKQNAGVLFNVTIVSAVILTATGVSYVVFQAVGTQMYDNYPQTIGISAKGLSVESVIDPKQVEQTLAKDGVEIQRKIKVTGLPVTVHADKSQPNSRLLMLSAAAYNREAKKVDRRTVEVKPGHAIYVYPSRSVHFGEILLHQTVPVSISGNRTNLFFQREIDGSIINVLNNEGIDNTLLIVNNNQYHQFASSVRNDQKITYVGYDLKNWRAAQHTVKKIRSAVPGKKRYLFTSRTSLLGTNDVVNLALFVGVFISLLFFIAAGSLVYFKLFTDLPKDVEQLKALRRLGMTEGEMSRVMTVQVFVIFFVPFFVATIHSLFAFNMMRVSGGVGGKIFQYSWTVIAIFFVIQLIYYWITKNVYMRQLFRR